MQLNHDTVQALQDIENYTPIFDLNKLKPYNSNYHNVLLTGANGYIAVHIIDELIKQNKNIYCAVRASDIEAVKDKIIQSFSNYNLKHLINHPNLYYVVMDLAKPNLGLAGTIWEMLCQAIDTIIHNGAYVHHLQTYERLKATNIDSVIELIRLATTHKLKSIQFTSTTYTSITEMNNYAHEGMPSICPPRFSFGYTVSKWAGEWILWKAAQIGLPINIFRLGQISGHSQTGASNYQKNNFTRLLLGCIQMGYAPYYPMSECPLPVDITAKAIVAIMSQPYSRPNSYILVNRNVITYNEIFSIAQQLGYPLEIIPYTQWVDKLHNINEQNLLHPLVTYYSKTSLEQNLDTEYQFSQTYAILDNLNIKVPEDYLELYRKYFTYWIKAGFFIFP